MTKFAYVGSGTALERQVRHEHEKPIPRWFLSRGLSRFGRLRLNCCTRGLELIDATAWGESEKFMTRRSQGLTRHHPIRNVGAAVAAAALGALLLGGCGDDDDDTPASTPTPAPTRHADDRRQPAAGAGTDRRTDRRARRRSARRGRRHRSRRRCGHAVGRRAARQYATSSSKSGVFCFFADDESQIDQPVQVTFTASDGAHSDSETVTIRVVRPDAETQLALATAASLRFEPLANQTRARRRDVDPAGRRQRRTRHPVPDAAPTGARPAERLRRRHRRLLASAPTSAAGRTELRGHLPGLRTQRR